VARCARILLASDDLASSAAVGGALEAARHEVRICERHDALSSQVATVRPDAVILDLSMRDPAMLPALVHRVHASYRPLLLCAVDHGSPQRLAALEAGADACIDRPYTPDEVVIHLRALLRRAPWLARRVHQVGALVVDQDAHVALFRDQPVELNAKEFGILAMLAEHAGTVLSKPKLLEALWGYDAYDENLVEVHVSALRRRLPAEARALLHTVRKVGYVLREDVAQARPA
jgi:DNA-binding response OmpR family regulator